MTRLLACLALSVGGAAAAAPPKVAATPPVPDALKPFKTTFRVLGPPPGVLAVNLVTVPEPLTAEQWEALTSLPIKVFAATGKGIDDGALDRLSKLPLTSLSLQHPSVTDAGAAALGRMKELKTLTLVHASKLTGKAAAALAGHPSLESVSSDEGFAAGGTAHLASCPKLKTLRLYHGFVTDETVTPLAKNATIETLNLSPLLTAGVSDAALASLATMTGLKDVTISHTVLTYAGGLNRLKELTNLTKLTLTEVGVSDADLAKLRADLPNVKVVHTPMTAKSRAEWEALAAKRPEAK